MDVEFFVYGVPNGEGFWGKEEDKNYFGTFYNNSKDEIRLFIQTRSLKGQPYCYYNYLVYKTVDSQTPNVVAYDGRDGSFFGISLRFDGYCKDVANMYRILDTVFNVYVMGSLLKTEKSKLKYTFPDFANVSAILKEIERATMQMVKEAFTNDSFMKLDGFAMSGGSSLALNLYDCTADNILEIVKKNSKVAISPYCPTNKEKTLVQQCNAQIQSVQQQCDARLKAEADSKRKEVAEINSLLSSEKGNAARLQKEIEQQNGTIGQLNQQVNRLQSEIRSTGQNRKVAQIVAPIREPIIELAAILKRTTSYSGGDDRERENNETDFPIVKVLKSLMSFINFLLLLLIIVLMIFLLNPFGDEAKNDGNLKEKIEKLKKENEELRNQMGDAGHDVMPTSNPSFDFNKVTIDIKGYGGKGAHLKLGQDYVVEAKNSVNGGVWEGEGCTITPIDSTQTKITPTAENVKIVYRIGENVKERKLKAKNETK